MKTVTYKILTFIAIILMTGGLASCVDDLNTIPLDEEELVSEVVFGSELGSYQELLAKIYAGLAVSGNSGGDGDPDVAGVDGGSQASFLRGLWNLQQLPTDEAHCAWNDVGIPDLNHITWTSSNVFIKGFYYRLYYQINLANALLRETSEEKLSSRGVSQADQDKIKAFRAEARFHRALAYYYLLDMFRNVPFVNEESPVGSTLPPQIMAADLFDYIEKELTECESDMLDPFVGYNATNYGRAHKAANWSLLSRLYLNAETYIGVKKYTESITNSKKVMAVNFQLDPVYANIFKADNHNSPEMIFPVRYDGADTQTWGGMTFLLSAMEPSDLQAEVNAVGAWQGNRATKAILNTFEREYQHEMDSRFSMIRIDFTENVEIVDPSLFTNNGIPVVKYYNRNSDGTLPPSNIAYTDFPLFRLGEIYLNYAEAVLRGGTGGDAATALQLVNNLRKRGYNGNSAATLTAGELTLDYILDERGREFFYEGQRRTDLVRYGKLTGSAYNWPWKGSVAGGRSVADYFNVYPIPADDIGANENLVQNSGYESSNAN
ncbi:MAG TPA: RagB/SusD family nutrient uptake outer membrane protein [Proteiniphilum sp.]|nr:RagB/SusD family nutrient uptake outer membrane protein [Proteiniphilum sp.]HPJ50582.1 RagB/SusD family nutrient uptake outer membrane protein [Proteiniphilum sp.]HPR18955.1 RagB/SusD family nutrient uptake outer membrane protein [Proteiniphilum sp.]